ncbi:SOS response-associated peptidase family protein [Leucobacter albus]|uniref:SOS response-associated peptidase family protein n=1 Tax=Leucobacter albus TaxID=272210 RepID=A0ABW3TKR7_9MICO
MCAGYGLAPSGPNSRRDERPGLRGPIPPGDTPAGFALIEQWIADRGGKASITGRNALNLNPLIREIDGEREFELGWWWLHVGGAPAKYTAFNARADRLLQSWKTPFQHRAILPATWYVEKGVRFELPDGEEFGMAAVTAPGLMPDGTDVRSYSLVTRDALGTAATVHDRMPLVLPRELHDEWLAADREGDASLVARALSVSEEISHLLAAQAAADTPASAPAKRQAKAFAPAEPPTLF